AVLHAGNLDGVLLSEIEEHPIVATAETEAGQGCLELFHVAGAAGQVAIDTVENLHGGIPFDHPNICTGFRRPDDRDPLRRGFFVHWFRPNSRRISSCGMPSPRASEARARCRAAAVSGVISSSSIGARASERASGSTSTSSRLRTAFSFSAGSMSSNA